MSNKTDTEALAVKRPNIEKISLGIGSLVRDLGGRMLQSDWEQGCWCDFVIGLDALANALGLRKPDLHAVYGEFTFRLYRFDGDDGWYLNLPNMLVFDRDYKDRWMRESMSVMIEQGQVQFLLCDKMLTLRSLVSIGLPVLEGMRASMTRLVESWELLIERLDLASEQRQSRLTHEAQKAVWYTSRNHSPDLGIWAKLTFLSVWWKCLIKFDRCEEAMDWLPNRLKSGTAQMLKPSRLFLPIFAVLLPVVVAAWMVSGSNTKLLAERLTQSLISMWQPHPENPSESIVHGRDAMPSLFTTQDGLLERVVTPDVYQPVAELFKFRYENSQQISELERQVGTLKNSLADAKSLLRSISDRVWIAGLTKTRDLVFLSSQGFNLVQYGNDVVIYFPTGVDELTVRRIMNWYPAARFCPVGPECDPSGDLSAFLEPRE
jgi:hypothetical protein